MISRAEDTDTAARGGGATPGSFGRAALVLSGCLLAAFSALRLAGWRLAVPSLQLSDRISYYEPKFRFAADRLATGALPLWNPFEFGGIPFLATIQPAVFYPVTRAAFALFHSDAAYDALFLCQLAIGAFSTLGLMREWRASLPASVLASLWVLHPPWLLRAYDEASVCTAISLFPALVWALFRLFRSPDVLGIAALTVAASLEVFAGYPPCALAAAYVAAIAFGCFVATELSRGDRERIVRVTVALLAAVVFTTLVTAIQTMPTLELAQNTGRSSEVSQFQSLAAPDDVVAGFGFPSRSLAGLARRLRVEYGPLILALALFPAVSRRKTAATYFVLALFAMTPLMPYQAIARLPLYEYVRYGFEWGWTASFSVFLAAGVGLDEACRRFLRIEKRAPFLAALVLSSAFTLSWPKRNAGVTAAPAPTPMSAERVAALCDLTPGGGRILWPRGEGRALLLDSRLESLKGYEDSLLPLRNAVIVEFLSLGNGLEGVEWLPRLAAERHLVARLGLTCVVTPGRSSELERAGFEHVPRHEPGFEFYRVPSPVPRARVAFTPRVARSPTEALALTAGTRDPTHEVVLEAEPPAPLRSCDRADDARARIVDYREEEVHVAVSTPCRGILVLSDSFFDGWRASMDGGDAPILRADYLFRGVAVEAGDHEVVFRYRPTSVAVGKVLSLLGLTALVAGIVLSRARRKMESLR